MVYGTSLCGWGPDQLFLLATSMRDWLDEGHLAWFMIDVVAKVDTTAFHAIHANDGPGRPAYDPDMMLAMLYYAYGIGMRSSRRIEAACSATASACWRKAAWALDPPADRRSPAQRPHNPDVLLVTFPHGAPLTV